VIPDRRFTADRIGTSLERQISHERTALGVQLSALPNR
jgi:hypothetical protein